jgi:hypothetical protein
MKNKIIAGSILAGLGIIAQVLNQWLKHIFITLFISKAKEILKNLN